METMMESYSRGRPTAGNQQPSFGNQQTTFVRGDQTTFSRDDVLRLPPCSRSPGSDSSREDNGSPLVQEDPTTATPAQKYPDYCRTLQITDSNGAVKELVFPKALDLDRPKRARTTFSAEQLYKLECEFQRNQYLVGRERTDLAITLQLSETQVKVWFQNRRTKYKRDNSRQADERKQHAEGLAACNILRMLQHTAPATKSTPPGPPPVRPPPPPTLPSHPSVLQPIPIALSITNRPPGDAALASSHLMTSQQTTSLFSQTTAAAPRFHFPHLQPPLPPNMAAAHGIHGFTHGFYGAS